MQKFQKKKEEFGSHRLEMSDKKVESDPTWFKATWPHRRFPSYPFTFLLHYPVPWRHDHPSPGCL